MEKVTFKFGLLLGFLATINIALPTKDIQRQIVAELDAQMQVLDGLRSLQAAARRKIAQTLAEVWGVEQTEPFNVEVEHE